MCSIPGQAAQAPAQAVADRPTGFVQRAHRDGTAIIVPRVSSESATLHPDGLPRRQNGHLECCQRHLRRRAVAVRPAPVADAHGVGSMRSVGAMKTRLPLLRRLWSTTPSRCQRCRRSDKDAGQGWCGRRCSRRASSSPTARWPSSTTPTKMPAGLREAHQIARRDGRPPVPRPRPFESDEERLELLFDDVRGRCVERQRRRGDA